MAGGHPRNNIRYNYDLNKNALLEIRSGCEEVTGLLRKRWSLKNEYMEKSQSRISPWVQEQHHQASYWRLRVLIRGD